MTPLLLPCLLLLAVVGLLAVVLSGAKATNSERERACVVLERLSHVCMHYCVVGQ